VSIFADNDNAISDDDGDAVDITIGGWSFGGNDAGISSDANVFVQQCTIDVSAITDPPHGGRIPESSEVVVGGGVEIGSHDDGILHGDIPPDMRSHANDAFFENCG
jgi:hypothetical protein